MLSAIKKKIKFSEVLELNTALVDYRISEEEKYSLENLGFKAFKCPPSSYLYEAVCGHPDMLLNKINDHTVLVHKEIDNYFVELLQRSNINVVFSHNSLESEYPRNVILNAINLQNVFVHNTKYTDLNLMSMVKNKKILNVKQGYTKCSTAIVNERAFITSDTGIASALREEDFDVLFIPPGDILLPGLNYGFIGGSCGLLSSNLLAFYGDLNCYAYGTEVQNFLEKHNVKPVFLRKGKLIDRGSIISF
jgi:hypothetical protein